MTLFAFDLDGTLIDARGRQVGVASEALAAVTGERLDAARFWRLKRGGATTLAALIRLGHGSELSGEVARRWAERVEDDDWLDRDRALPGAARVLKRLGSDGYRLVVLTARRRGDGAARSLRASGLAPLVDAIEVVDPRAVVTAKAKALARLAPAGFIGDTDTDGDAAARAGIPFAAVATGQRSPTYLAQRGYAPARSLSAAVHALVVSAFGAPVRI